MVAERVQKDRARAGGRLRTSALCCSCMASWPDIWLAIWAATCGVICSARLGCAARADRFPCTHAQPSQEISFSCAFQQAKTCTPAGLTRNSSLRCSTRESLQRPPRDGLQGASHKGPTCSWEAGKWPKRPAAAAGLVWLRASAAETLPCSCCCPCAARAASTQCVCCWLRPMSGGGRLYCSPASTCTPPHSGLCRALLSTVYQHLAEAPFLNHSRVHWAVGREMQGSQTKTTS